MRHIIRVCKKELESKHWESFISTWVWSTLILAAPILPVSQTNRFLLLTWFQFKTISGKLCAYWSDKDYWCMSSSSSSHLFSKLFTKKELSFFPHIRHQGHKALCYFILKYHRSVEAAESKLFCCCLSEMCWDLSCGSGLTGVWMQTQKLKHPHPHNRTLILVCRNHNEATADSVSNLREHTWGQTLVNTLTSQSLQGVRKENLPVFTDNFA